MIENFDDGRKKSFFCTAVNLLELKDIEYVIEKIMNATSPDASQKEKSQNSVHLFQTMAEKRNIVLQLRKKLKSRS